MSDDLPKLPAPLEKMIDKVLAYKPKKAKAKAAKKRKKNKIALPNAASKHAKENKAPRSE